MNISRFDLVTVGGGLGASALALSMAKHGARVLVLERENQFRDRVRGEALPPWGVAEAKELDIADVLLRTCAKEVPWVEMGFVPRNLVETTPQHAPFFTFSHPEMQEALLAEAARAGAQVRRGVTVEAIEPDPNNPVVVARDKSTERIAARFVVAADGRASGVRKGRDLQHKRTSSPSTLPEYF
jgi:2-polyprenyl-6-methoxyphenol hydroxylase-like FAD-dependent oxidoreductase